MLLLSRLQRQALHAGGLSQQLQRQWTVQNQSPGRVGVLVRGRLVREGMRHLLGARLLRQEGQRRR